MASTKTKKRNADKAGLDMPGSSSAAKKVFPIFDRQANGKEDANSAIRWKKLPFISSSCLFGETASPQIRPRIAAFDLDGTLMKWPPPKVESQWEYWHRSVPKALKDAHEDGYSVVILSNQNLRSDRLVSWKKKIGHFSRALSDMEIPFFIFASTLKDGYRKPMPGMWVALERLAQEGGVSIDMEASFFVGDAAGRPNDYSGTDRKLAENLSLRYMTPEEYFLKAKPQPYALKGKRMPDILKLDLPNVTPTSLPVLPSKSAKPELVLFVGCPATGKTTFYEETFRPAGYEHVNQDTLGNRNKCLEAAEDWIRSGVSCAVDNTNRDRKTRQLYVELAKKLGVSIRCFKFEASRELAWHNNLYRAYCIPMIEGGDKKRPVLPYSAFVSYFSDYEEPALEEGFSELRVVHWKFDGSEEHARYWNMWLQIDGK